MPIVSCLVLLIGSCGKLQNGKNDEVSCDLSHYPEVDDGSSQSFLALTSLPGDIQRSGNGLPLLQSDPGANVALYLDFDGGTYYGYDDVYGPADLDGRPSVFGDGEAEKIYNAYLHVVNAFANFDVNVTTIERAARSANKWAWIIISDDYSRTGGKGKIGIFERSSYNNGRPTQATALAGAQAVLVPRSYEVGYLLVHELGHNFGLHHAGRMRNGSFTEFSDYSSGPTGAFMGGRGSQFDRYRWMDLVIDSGDQQNSASIIGGITGSANPSDPADPQSDLLGEGEGDCDDSSECQAGLSCVNTNSGLIESYTSKVSGAETCEQVSPPQDDDDSNLLAEGEGDCDDSSECQAGLSCVNTNSGLIESYTNKVSGAETCEQVSPPQDDDDSNLLAEGEGDCDDSSECQAGLSCVNTNSGLIESFTNKVSGAETCEQVSPPQDDDDSNLLAEGEGDCDDSSECQAGLICVNTNSGLIESFTNKVSGAETCEALDDDTSSDPVRSNFQVKVGGQWKGVCCGSNGPVISGNSCEWRESGRYLIDLTNDLRLDCPENNGNPVKCTCNRSGERFHGAPGGPVSTSIYYPGGAPIFPNIGRETCLFVNRSGKLESRLSDVRGNKWSDVNGWPDKDCLHFKLEN